MGQEPILAKSAPDHASDHPHQAPLPAGPKPLTPPDTHHQNQNTPTPHFRR